jgi:hypothetical protein
MKYLRLLCLCVLGWWPMMAVHEFGHVIGCLFSGATVERVVLWPWTLSQTIRSHSEAPLVDTWFGPVFGAVAPLLAYCLLKQRRFPGRSFLGFFTGFCLLSNGLYIGLGWIDRIGDAGDLLRGGAPKSTLIGFGLVCVICGLAVWSRELFKPGRMGSVSPDQAEQTRGSSES